MKVSRKQFFMDDCNEEFVSLLASYNFKWQIGPFSDISILASELGIAGANISCGYHNPHSNIEYLEVIELDMTIEQVSAIFNDIIAGKINKKYRYQLPSDIGQLFLYNNGYKIYSSRHVLDCVDCASLLDCIDKMSISRKSAAFQYYYGRYCFIFDITDIITNFILCYGIDIKELLDIIRNDYDGLYAAVKDTVFERIDNLLKCRRFKYRNF